jgi:uncharacterized protein YjiS (DUF1127 family)
MSLINLIAAVVNAFPESRREDAYSELMVLDDHSLADIGLHRSDIVAGLHKGTLAIDAVPERPIAPCLKAAADIPDPRRNTDLTWR